MSATELNFDRHAIMDACRVAERGCRARLMSYMLIDQAIQTLSACAPTVTEVRVDAGAVANSYSQCAESTYLWLHRDGRFHAARKKARTVAYGDTGRVTTAHTPKHFA